MAHWSHVTPLPILDISYEDVVHDQEGKSREMIEFLGLDWDELPKFLRQRWACSNCIEVAGSPADLHAFLERWRDYEDFLSPFSALSKQVRVSSGTLSRNAVSYISERTNRY